MTKTTRRRPSASVQSPLETYLREINETSLLSAADEHELAVAIGNGDTLARDRMVAPICTWWSILPADTLARA